MIINIENMFCVFGYDFSKKKFVVNGSEKQSAFLNMVVYTVSGHPRIQRCQQKNFFKHNLMIGLICFWIFSNH